jgi:aminopeptidase
MLTDPRIKQLARVLTHYSLGLRAGDLFVIRAQPLAAPLVEECYRQALILGAHPHVDLRLPGLDEIYYRTANEASYPGSRRSPATTSNSSTPSSRS